jgi:hypothetical protein
MIPYLKSAQRQFEYYKQLGEQSMLQLPDEMLFWKANEEMNSIAIIVKHLWGNMLSRWTDFRTTDGEKPWRTRDAEFEQDVSSRVDVMKQWDQGWTCLFDALASIDDNNLEEVIYIRNEAHTILDAINRQIAHYSYHVGQIVFVAKMLQNDQWKSLSIPRNESDRFNAKKFEQKQ